MINHFTFHSVGQGLFYTGCLNHGKYTFVYDCGSTSRGVYLQSEISKFAQYHTDIDFVVLSHMHADHINGITDLCQQCNVKKIYLPYLGHDGNVTALILANTLLTGNHSSPASLNAFNTLSYLYGLTDVAENGQRLSRKVVEFWGSDDDNDSKSEENGYIYSSHNFPCLDNGTPYWEFKMLNRAMGVGILHQLSTSLQALLAGYKYIHNQNVSILDVVNMGKIDDIKQLYQQVFAGIDINLTSTLLIHYPTDSVAQSSINFCQTCLTKHCRWCNRPHSDCTTTVLTGDVSFDKHLSNEVNNSISSLPHCILQIPHHGSLRNWNSIDKSLLNHSDVFVISHGHNNVHHPNRAALQLMRNYLCSNRIRSATQVQDYKYVIWT